MDFAWFLLILPLLYLLSTTSTVQSSFRCSNPATCGALVGYAPYNASTLSDIQSLFNVEDFRSLLSANNLPLSTPRTHIIKSKQTVRVPINCMCYNNTGVSSKLPLYSYTVKKDDGLYFIASTVFSGLLDYREIMVVNGISDENLIDIGQKLWIPLPCSCDEVGGDEVVHYAHVVEVSSSVESIAQQFGTDSQTLLNVNGMKNDSQLMADRPLDVPLKACNSSIRRDSLDYPLLVANGSYVITANDCVKCYCDSANNWILQCQPSQLPSSKWKICPPMQCEASGGPLIGNMTSSSTCDRSTCTYAGYNDQTIFTSLTMESTCSRKWKLKLIIGLAVAVPVAITVAIIFIVLHFRLKTIKNDERVEAFFLQYGSLTPNKFSYSDIKKITNSFNDKLGQGGYGSVYKGELPDGRIVAVKVLSKSKGDGQDFINEVASISRTSHVNIVTLLGFCYERSKRALIYEFMPNGSLDRFISNQGSAENFHLAIKTLYEIALGIARGLEYLHQGCTTRILHFDIKPQNILLDASFCPKIADFGLAKLCKTRDTIVSMTGARGTCGYIAPEVFWGNFGGVSCKSDVYSYGMMVLEMIGGRRKNVNVEASHSSEMYFPTWLYKQLEKSEKLNLDRIIADEEEEMTRKMIVVSLWCIQTIPSNRPSMSKVLEMLQGSLEALPLPPEPLLSSPAAISLQNSNTTSSVINTTSSVINTTSSVIMQGVPSTFKT